MTKHEKSFAASTQRDAAPPTGIQRAAHRGLDTLASRLCAQIGRRVPKEARARSREAWDYRSSKTKIPRRLRGRLKKVGIEFDGAPGSVETEDTPDVLDSWWIAPEDEPPKPGRPVMPAGWWIEIPFEENRLRRQRPPRTSWGLRDLPWCEPALLRWPKYARGLDLGFDPRYRDGRPFRESCGFRLVDGYPVSTYVRYGRISVGGRKPAYIEDLNDYETQQETYMEAGTRAPEPRPVLVGAEPLLTTEATDTELETPNLACDAETRYSWQPSRQGRMGPARKAAKQARDRARAWRDASAPNFSILPTSRSEREEQIEDRRAKDAKRQRRHRVRRRAMRIKPPPMAKEEQIRHRRKLATERQQRRRARKRAMSR
jgi:hypothetical protein